jgi:secondary thiamine-phosphate synthase enzyme
LTNSPRGTPTTGTTCAGADDNGSSHVRAALLGPSLTIPFANGDLLLGTWQQIMLLEFDTRPRDREIVIQVIGD